MENKIKFELVLTNFHTRWPCDICGGNTEKVDILCESKGGPFKTTRICERCLKERDFDEQLRAQAQRLREDADALETMVGKIDAPTYEEMCLMQEQVDDYHKDERERMVKEHKNSIEAGW